ncbi:MAG: Transposon gamma-delta resolvase [Deltaproteobacteria bacterium]|jgi:DNA invertase Pin-like site-specific DNA recombinase|nr:Transposon gamma-delta resolvase [Deltaproteobacteria bacterium]
MSIYGYARLNDHRPTPKNLGIRNQVKIIRQWTEDKGLTIRKIFRDTASNSASLDLPNLKKLISLVENGEVSVLVVARLDRLTRAIRLHQQLLNLFKENNVRFVSIAEGLDSKTKSGKKVLEAINILALWDAKSIPDRTKQMIERKRKIGEHVGHAPFGFTYQKKRLTPLEKELAIASIIREKREDENLSYHKIAKFLNSQRLRAKRGGRWYAETIKVICENPLYERDSKAKNESLSR